ncbi:MAG TPA: sulfurtransferase [Pseudolabrys sp.]|nr:sulfurtransferase [Pseudolabrys sp.]
MTISFSRIGAVAALALAIVAAAPALAAEPLVSPQWLHQHLHDQDIVVLDVRSAIDGGGEKAYLAAHIPGSVHSDYDKPGWRVTVHNVPFMLPSILEIQDFIGNLGIDQNSHVVVVPAGVSFTDFGSAARVYWTLKVAGVPNVSILDGGVAAWKAAGLPTESGPSPTPTPKTLDAEADKSSLAELADVARIEKSGGATLIDARPASFFKGKERAPKVQAYGHIPGAIDVDSDEFYDDKANRLKPLAELAKIASRIPAGPVVTYCNTGHWSATDWFVLHELLGRKDVKLYDGSMVEWTMDPHRPVVSDRTKWDDLKKKLGFGS